MRRERSGGHKARGGAASPRWARVGRRVARGGGSVVTRRDGWPPRRPSRGLSCSATRPTPREAAQRAAPPCAASPWSRGPRALLRPLPGWRAPSSCEASPGGKVARERVRQKVCPPGFEPPTCGPQVPTPTSRPFGHAVAERLCFTLAVVRCFGRRVARNIRHSRSTALEFLTEKEPARGRAAALRWFPPCLALLVRGVAVRAARLRRVARCAASLPGACVPSHALAPCVPSLRCCATVPPRQASGRIPGRGGAIPLTRLGRARPVARFVRFASQPAPLSKAPAKARGPCRALLWCLALPCCGALLCLVVKLLCLAAPGLCLGHERIRRFIHFQLIFKPLDFDATPIPNRMHNLVYS